MDTILYAVGIAVILLLAMWIVYLKKQTKNADRKAEEGGGNPNWTIDEASRSNAEKTVPVEGEYDDDGEEETWILPEDETAEDSERARIWYVRLVDVERLNKRYEVSVDRCVTVGFHESSDVCINYDHSVSRYQCEIIRRGSEFFLVNHSSSNITCVNDKKATGEVPLGDGDIITMGRVKMRFETIC